MQPKLQRLGAFRAMPGKLWRREEGVRRGRRGEGRRGGGREGERGERGEMGSQEEREVLTQGHFLQSFDSWSLGQQLSRPTDYTHSQQSQVEVEIQKWNALLSGTPGRPRWGWPLSRNQNGSQGHSYHRGRSLQGEADQKS